MNPFNSKIIITLLILPFFKPAYFSTIPVIDTIYDVLRIISALFTVIFVVTKKYKISKFIYVLIIYRVVTLISTIIFAGDLLTWFNRTCMIVITSLIIECSLKNDVEKTLKVLTTILITLITINLITWRPNGLYINPTTGKAGLFLGLRTRIADCIFPAIAISVINSYYKKNRFTISTIFLFIVSITTFVFEWVATAVLGVVLLIFLIVVHRVEIFKKINIVVLAIAAFILNVSIVFFRIQNLFSFIIVDILNKSLTLTDRTYIWDAAIEMIKKSPLLGYGEVVNGTFAFHGWQLWQGHNQIIQLLHDGGIIAVCAFIVMNYFAIKELLKYKNYAVSRIVGFSLFIIYLMMITEIPGYYVYFYVILTVAANLEIIINSYREKQIKK